MKHKLVLRLEKQPMTGLVNTRCEKPLSTFYTVYAALRGVDPSDVHREALRAQAKAIARKHPRLKRYAKEIASGI